MAKELGPKGIHVAHAIIDGVIDVPRVHETMPDFAAAKGEEGLIDPKNIAEMYFWLHEEAALLEVALRLDLSSRQRLSEPWNGTLEGSLYVALEHEGPDERVTVPAVPG